MKRFMMLVALLAMVLIASAPALAQDETTGITTDEGTNVVSPDGNNVVSPDGNDGGGGLPPVPERGADEGTRTLPFTGGVLPVAAALGTLLIAGGLIARRFTR